MRYLLVLLFLSVNSSYALTTLYYADLTGESELTRESADEKELQRLKEKITFLQEEIEQLKAHCMPTD